MDVKIVRRTKKSWGVLLAALLMGGAAFWLSSHYLGQQEAALRQSVLGSFGDSRQVVVAARHLEPGDVAGPDTMALARVPAGNLSGAAVTPEMFGDFAGRILKQPMSPGEPLLAHFVSGDVISRFSDLLSLDERAVTLQVNELNSNARMLTSGDYVDIYLLLEPPQDSKSAVAAARDKVLLPLKERVRILSVGRMPLLSREQDFVIVPDRGADEHYATVTVGLPREDAARLTLANDLGELVFMLRNVVDEAINDDPPLDRRLLWTDLVSGEGRYIQFYSASNSENGVMQATPVAVESLGQASGRRAVKSLPLNRARILTAAGTEQEK